MSLSRVLQDGPNVPAGWVQVPLPLFEAKLKLIQHSKTRDPKSRTTNYYTVGGRHFAIKLTGGITFIDPHYKK